MSRFRPRVQSSLVLVDADTRQRVQALVLRYGALKALRLVGVSAPVFESVRFEGGAVQPRMIARVRERLDAIEREEAVA